MFQDSLLMPDVFIVRCVYLLCPREHENISHNCIFYALYSRDKHGNRHESILLGMPHAAWT